ncbi:MAG: DNA polymerase III subunit gamma/tau [Gammaproteobacteria bacterium]|nr:DNA polymerase III subunit gamma/tau [Gammaproteobacteria bacterium]
MSYLVLARKYRPRAFADVVGQEHVVRALANALDHARLHHAYLFTGTRGVGKTTLARILAACLNCETGVTSTPCGTCPACEAIAAGRFMDLVEVDAASRTGVDDTRDLLTNAQFLPGQGRFKVYLIDEVHMLTGHSFNALLKTLEEPPEHVKFLLATTEARKIPVTVLSRCLQFHLKNMLPETIEGQLARILADEAVEAESAALAAIARSARGSMRDALSIADQAISHGAGRIEAESVNAMLGVAGRDEIGVLLEALAAQDGEALLAAADELSRRSLDLAAVLGELQHAFHDLAVAAQLDADPAPPYDRFAKSFSAEDLQIYYQIALIGARDLPFAPDPKVGFDMTLVRLLSFEPLGSAPGPSGAPQSAPADAGDGAPDVPEAGGTDVAAAQAAPAAGTALPAWHELVAGLAAEGVTLMILEHANLVAKDAEQWTVRLAQDHHALLNDTQRGEIAALVERHEGRPIEVRYEVGELAAETPAARKARLKNEREAQAKAVLMDDANVQTLLSDFDAKLESPHLDAG